MTTTHKGSSTLTKISKIIGTHKEHARPKKFFKLPPDGLENVLMANLPGKLHFGPGNMLSFLLELLKPRDASAKESTTMAQAESEGMSHKYKCCTILMNTVPNFDVMIERHAMMERRICETPIVKTPLYFSLFFFIFLFIHRGP